MRMIETFKKEQFKITIFKTDARYLLQLEDQSFILSWKISREQPYTWLKENAVPKILEEARKTWPQLEQNLIIPKTGSDTQEQFPNII